MTADTMQAGNANVVRTWFYILGAVLVLLGVVGSLGISHPIAAGLHLEGGEMWVHYVLGIATIGIAFAVKDTRALVNIAYVFAAVYVLVGLVGFVMPAIGIWHVAILDNITHILVGVVNGVVGWYASERAPGGTTARVGR
ncbi:MAG TPA: hypothetical protein VI997_00145 [Candidatus Thermoplasmatota archaeon]|nr:hypothetical protein [Candidatus Thermoplasmatota archaeon]